MKFSKEIKESLTLKFGQIARELISQGENVISMTVGEPDFKTPSYVEEATIEALKTGYTKYSNSQGLLELRTLIKENLNNEYNCSYDESNIIVTPGVKSGLHLALCSILEPNDEVIIMGPYYLSYPPLIKIAEPDAIIKDVPFKKDGKVNLELLAKTFNNKTKAILVNTPSNPTGKVLTLDEVNFIIALAKKYNTYIISDEIYDKLVFKEYTFHSFLGKNISDLLIYANGYSKSYSMTGYRLGYIVAKEDIIKKLLLLQQNINTNTNTFIQKGACSIYLNKETHLENYLIILKKRVAKFSNFLKTSKLFSGYEPEAGFYYFVDISKTKLNSEQLTEKLIKDAKIVVTPGIGFGENYDDYIRFSLAVSDETLDLAIKNLIVFEKNFLIG